jgi:protein-S-isoprenylcysteine O-methyltransferase Ste14
MSTLVVILRIVSLLAFAAPILLRSVPPTAIRASRGARAPLVAHLAAFALYLPSLLALSGSDTGAAALWLASSGSVLAIAGGALVVRSRIELGSAWSFVPKADMATGLVTTGPYRLVRHPIYLGVVVLTIGQALAFASWPALVVVLCGIVPSFVWRASAEEKLLGRTFGEPYAVYRRQTWMIVPYLL